MESDVLQRWEKAIGTNAVNVIKETATQWIFYEYLSEKPYAVLGLQVASLDDDRAALIHWAGHNTSTAFRQDVCKRSMRNFLGILKDAIAVIDEETKKENYSFLMLDELTITDGKYYIEVGVLKLEDYIYYLFAPAKTDPEALFVRTLIFGQCYAICRALAPRSNSAFQIVNKVAAQDKYDELGLVSEIRNEMIGHVEVAFQRNMLESIASWKEDP